MNESIITSLLDTDFYKFTMGQLIFHTYPDVQVRYAFTNRTKRVNLADFIDEVQLREELDNVRRLRFTNSELHYLRGTDEYGARMFKEDYLLFLRNFQLPPYRLERTEGGYILEFSGSWAEVMYWEIYSLAIVNELYYRALMKELTKFEQDAVYATGILRQKEKIHMLRRRPDITFSDFSTRRRFSKARQDYAVQAMVEELPGQFLGTSNVKLAMDRELLPMGTSGHEGPMGLYGVFYDSENPPFTAQQKFFELWWDEYGEGLSIFLPDTWGSEFGFSVMTGEQAHLWKGFRQDSGDAIAEGERGLRFYEHHYVDARKKLVIFSDGLEVKSMITIADHFYGRTKYTFGWGTNLANDFGLAPISIVVKLVEANGHPVPKLSDNLAKATGDPAEIERAKIFCGYTGRFYQQTKY